MATTTIQISHETRDKLKEHGHKGQTYDEIIDALLENRVKFPEDQSGPSGRGRRPV